MLQQVVLSGGAQLPSMMVTACLAEGCNGYYLNILIHTVMDGVEIFHGTVADSDEAGVMEYTELFSNAHGWWCKEQSLLMTFLVVQTRLANDGTTVDDGSYLNMFDSYGDGWNSSVFTLWTAADSDGDGVMEYTEYFSATLSSGSEGQAYIPGSGDVFGCMDPTAENYNSAATIDDGSCTFSCLDNEYVVTVDGETGRGEVSWEIV